MAKLADARIFFQLMEFPATGSSLPGRVGNDCPAKNLKMLLKIARLPIARLPMRRE
jgi:hypothetical protein